MKLKKDKLDQILKAGTKEFISMGFEAASMHEIAQKALVSKRTLYKYFAHKEDLLNAIINKLLDSMLSYCELTYMPDENFEEQLGKVIDSRIDFLTKEDYLSMSKLVLSELLRGKKLNEEHLAKVFKIDSHFVTFVDMAKKNGKISDKYDSWFISKHFHSLIKGDVFYPVIEGFKNPKDIDKSSLKNFLMEFFIHFFC